MQTPESINVDLLRDIANLSNSIIRPVNAEARKMTLLEERRKLYEVHPIEVKD